MKRYIIQLIILLNLLFSGVQATEWRVQHHLRMDFNAVWGSAANDVFAVGREGLIFHYDGSQWREMDTGMINSEVFYHLRDIWGTSSTDVFAVGYDTILHYDGNQWTAMNSGISTINLEGIWGTSSTDVFAVGHQGIILHYDGNQWTAMDSGTSSMMLLSVWGSSSNDVFAGGNGGILHYDGQQWTSMAGVISSVISIEGTSSTDVFAIEGIDSIFHYNGQQWTPIQLGGSMSATTDLWVSSSTEVFAVGTKGKILHYDGSNWTTMNSGTSSDLTSIWGTSSTDIFAVGWDGTILHYDGSQWSTLNTMPYSPFNRIWGTSSTDMFAVGENGKIVHSDGNQLTAMNSGTSASLKDIWGSSNQNIFTVGDKGTLLHYDGNNWTTLDSGTEIDLNGIWGSSATDIFVVGDTGTILHSDGNSWTTLDSGTPSNLNGIWGSSSTDVFIVGKALILHYDGAQWTSEKTGMPSSNIWGSSSQDVFMVVDISDRIFHYDGNQWQSINLGNFYLLTSLWGSSNTDVFAAGITPDNPGWGIIIHYDGNTWMETTQIEMGSDASPSSTLWGSPEGDVFAIIDSAILRCTDCQQKTSNLQSTPRSHNFWNIAVGDQDSQTFTVTNTGNSDEQLQPLVLANTTDFALNHDTCSNTLLTPTNTCQVTVDFQAQSEGTKLTKLTIPSSTATTDILLAGTGCSATFQQVFKLYPESPNLGTILVGDAITLNQTVSFTAIQGCGEELQLENIEVIGESATEFSIQDLDCTNSHWDKYSYSYCQFNTVFTPTTVGEKQAELTFKLRDHPELLIPTVALQAKAIMTGPAQLELTPTDYEFGSVTLGVGSSEPQTFILNNTGELSLKLDNITLTGADAAAFSLDKWSCTVRNFLHPGEHCDLNVWFMPTSLGQKQATLTVTAGSLIMEALLTGFADSPKNCDNTNITIESSQDGNWNVSTTWSTSQIPNEHDVVRINAGHTVTAPAAAKVRTLCVMGTLQSLDNQGTALEIQATDYLENQGIILGQAGADELASSACTQTSIVGTADCAQPGASVILKVGTEFYQQGKLGDWWWYGSGGPILNTGEIIAGKGGDGLQYGAPGGNALVLGRNTTNTNRIQAGDGGNILSTQAGQGGRGGLTKFGENLVDQVIFTISTVPKRLLAMGGTVILKVPNKPAEMVAICG
ncbi:MAG: choice-of-anchor D domain-containing protein [Thioploca sp.]|nr:choice-of-anchor D domain-containing protein [Thioploca sp.]